MEIIYRAFDGKEFDDEEECRQYEHNMFTLPDAITFFDCNGEPRYPETPEQAWNAYQIARYMEIANIKSREEDVDFCKSCMNYVMPEDPKPGVYKYDGIWDKWHYLEGITPADLPIKETKAARRFCKTESVLCPYNWKNFCYYEGVCDGDFMEYIKNEENETED